MERGSAVIRPVFTGRPAAIRARSGACGVPVRGGRNRWRGRGRAGAGLAGPYLTCSSAGTDRGRRVSVRRASRANCDGTHQRRKYSRQPRQTPSRRAASAGRRRRRRAASRATGRPTTNASVASARNVPPIAWAKRGGYSCSGSVGPSCSARRMSGHGGRAGTGGVPNAAETSRFRPTSAASHRQVEQERDGEDHGGDARRRSAGRAGR